MRDGKENTEESFSWGNEFRARKITNSENSGDEEAGEREWRWGRGWRRERQTDRQREHDNDQTDTPAMRKLHWQRKEHISARNKTAGSPERPKNVP